MIEVNQQRCRRLEAVIGVVHPEGNLMGLAVAEQASKRREIHAVGDKIQRLDARNRSPQIGINSTGVDPRVDGSNCGWLPVDRDFPLAERSCSTALKLIRNIVRDTGVPELIVRLALRVYVEEGALDIRGQVEAPRERARRRLQGHRTPDGTGRER